MNEPQHDRCPIPQKKDSAQINGVLIHAEALGFTDKLVISLKDEREAIGPIFSIPLALPRPGLLLKSEESCGLPMVHLTPAVLLGGGSQDRFQVYAVQISSMVSRQANGESRTLILSLGIAPIEDGKMLSACLNLVEKVRIW